MIVDIANLSAHIPEQGRILGLDVGSKTIGLALSDTRRIIATPLDVMRRAKFADDAAHLEALIHAHEIVALVIGMPYNMDGSVGPRAQSTRAFARNLSTYAKVPMVLWDERLSSVAADRAMLAADMSRAKRKSRIDKSAAAFILQGALDCLRSLS